MQKALKALTRLGGYLDSIEREIDTLRKDADDWPPDSGAHARLAELEIKFTELDGGITALGTALSETMKAAGRATPKNPDDSWEDAINFFNMPTREEKAPPEFSRQKTPVLSKAEEAGINNAGTQILPSGGWDYRGGKTDRDSTETDPMFQEQAAEILRRALREEN